MQNSLDYNKFFADLKIAGQLKVEEDLGSGYVRLKISESERRQALQDIKCVEDIVTELLRNSRDAKSKNIFIATKKITEKKRLIYCIDDGRGIPQKFHNLIFQSRVTSKLEDGARDSYGFHGRGMALFSIKLNVDDIRIVYSDLKKGTCVLVDVDLEKIPEKKDQSALPRIVKRQDGYELAGGVNNIIRVLLEFALHNTDINFYFGSPTQVIATTIDLYRDSLNNKSPEGNIKKIKSFEDFDCIVSDKDIGLTGFGYYADNYIVLEQILKKFYGMHISVRGVQRLIYGEIPPLKPMDDSMGASGPQDSTMAYDDDGCIVNGKDDFNGSLSGPPLGANNANNSSKTITVGDSINNGVMPGGSFISEKEKNKDTDKDIRLHDELKLANRFKEEEIKYIISMLEKEIINRGSKYFITIENNIEFKKTNNTVIFTVNLKQKD